jgi:hypothetical protein
MMVRREMIADIGPLDEEYFLHSEDLDWCMRAWRGGRKILFVPNAQVVHHKGVSSRSRRLIVEYHKHKRMIRFYRNLLGNTHSRLLLALVAAGVQQLQELQLTQAHANVEISAQEAEAARKLVEAQEARWIRPRRFPFYLHDYCCLS